MTDSLFLALRHHDQKALDRLGFPCTLLNGNPAWIEACTGKTAYLLPLPATNEGTRAIEILKEKLWNRSARVFHLPSIMFAGKSFSCLSDFMKHLSGGPDDDETLRLALGGILIGEDSFQPVVEISLKRKVSLSDVIMPVEDFQAIEHAPRRNLLLPWLREMSIILVSGWRGVGKSWFALGVLIAIVNGDSFGPWSSELSVPCLYVDGEMPASDVSDRLKSLGITGTKSPLYVYSDSLANEMGLPRAHLGNRKWRDAIKKILIEKGVRFWVVDNLASLAPGIDENKKADYDPINSWFLELRHAGISSMLLHHVGKEGSQRGTSAREDNVDCSIILRQPHDYTPDEGCRFVCHFSKARVPSKDLPLIADCELKLMEDEGQYTFTWGNIKREIRRECLRLLADGIDQTSIVSLLGVSKGYVSKMKKAFIKDGLLSNSGKITPAGELVLAGN